MLDGDLSISIPGPSDTGSPSRFIHKNQKAYPLDYLTRGTKLLILIYKKKSPHRQREGLEDANPLSP